MPSDDEEQGSCSFSSLEDTFAESAANQKVFYYKRVYGILPAKEEREEMLREHKQLYRGRVSRILDAMSINGQTLALIYGATDGGTRVENGDTACVWLLGPRGLEASSTYTPTTQNSLAVLQAALKVVAEDTVRAPRRRGPRGCEPGPAEPNIDLTQALVALKETANALLPREIEVALLRLREREKRLLIIPTSNLRKFPFAAMEIAGEPLVEMYTPMVVPSVEDLGLDLGFVYFTGEVPTEDKILEDLPAAFKPKINTASAQNQQDRPRRRDKANGQQVLVVGDPDLSDDKDLCWPTLPGGRKEAESAAKSFKTEALFGKQATHATVMRRLKEGQSTLQLIYFATHAISDPENPADKSFLALHSRHLRGADLRKLSFTSNPIVVLSACETGLGKVFPDRGVFGLAEAWRFAGAKQIVMSLWQVNDAETVLLMERMTSLLRDGVGVEFALATAMREVRKSNPDPKIWAAFTAFGKPTATSTKP